MDFRNWLISILVAGGIGTFAVMITPEGGSKKTVALLSSALLFFAYLSLFGKLTPSFSAESYEDYKEEARREMAGAEQEMRNEIFEKTREECEKRAFIKAGELGLEADIEMSAAFNTDKGYMVEDVTVRYRKTPEEDAIALFKKWLREEMGIPLKKQRHIFPS